MAELYKERYPEGDAYVTGFVSRPVLRVTAVKGRNHRSHSFVEAIDKIAPDLAVTFEDFPKAHNQARRRFQGRMKEVFLVIEDGPVQDQAGPSQGRPGEAKRGRPDDENEEEDMDVEVSGKRHVTPTRGGRESVHVSSGQVQSSQPQGGKGRGKGQPQKQTRGKNLGYTTADFQTSR